MGLLREYQDSQLNKRNCNYHAIFVRRQISLASESESVSYLISQLALLSLLVKVL